MCFKIFFKFVNACLLLYFAVLFTPCVNVLSSHFDVSLNLEAVSIVRILINFARHFRVTNISLDMAAQTAH